MKKNFIRIKTSRLKPSPFQFLNILVFLILLPGFIVLALIQLATFFGSFFGEFNGLPNAVNHRSTWNYYLAIIMETFISVIFYLLLYFYIVSKLY